MSWGYWGIVTGLLVLVTVFFFCIDLLYDAKKRYGVGQTGAPAGTTTNKGSDTKHAA